MSNTKNLFDDFLERKMQEKVFEEKDSYWEQARALIDADRQKLRRKKLFFWTGFSTVFCSTLVLSILLLDPAESTNNKQVASIAPTGISAVTIPSPAAPELSTPVYAIESSAPSVQHETTTPVTDVPVAATNNIVSQPVTAPAQPAIIKPAEPAEVTNNIPATVTPVASAPVVRASKTITKTNTSVGNENNNKAKQETADIITDPVTTEVAAAPKEAAKPVESATASKGSQPSVPVNAKHEDVQQITYSMPSLLALIPDSSYQEKNIIIRRPPSSYTTPLYVSLEAGITHYNAKGLFASEQTGAYAGLNYTRFVNQRIGFSGGIGFSMLKQNLSRSYMVKQYGFGEKVSRTSIRTMELDYLELPLKMFYNIRGRHYLQAGATFAYLLQSQDRLVNPSEGKQDTRTSGFTKAILPYDVQLSVGYSVTFGERFMLNAAYYYGLSDVSKNNLFRSQATDRNDGYRLGVSYKLF